MGPTPKRYIIESNRTRNAGSYDSELLELLPRAAFVPSQHDLICHRSIDLFNNGSSSSSSNNSHLTGQSSAQEDPGTQLCPVLSRCLPDEQRVFETTNFAQNMKKNEHDK